MSNPEVRINFSWLLYEDVSRKITELNGWKLPSGQQCEEWTEAYRKSWSKHEQTILSAMQDMTGLEFYRDVIDIVTAPAIIPKSEPLIISFLDTPKNVIDTITHELSHTLLCDNKILSIYGPNRNFRLVTEWEKLFGVKDDFRMLVHIPVLAIVQKVFEDHLNDDKIVERDRKLMEKYGATSYLKAWDYIEKEGADKIIERLKRSYGEIARKLGSNK